MTTLVPLCQKLVSLRQAFVWEMTWLSDCFHASMCDYKNGIDCRASKLVGEMAIIRLHDSWARFSRNFVFTSAVHSVNSPTIKNLHKFQDAINVIHRSDKLNSTARKWSNPSYTIQIAEHLDVYNKKEIKVAFGNKDLHEDKIRIVRNFCAHKGKHSADEIRKKWTELPKPASINCFILAGNRWNAGPTRYGQWVKNFRLTAHAAVEDSQRILRSAADIQI